MTDSHEVIIIAAGADCMRASGKRDEIVYQIAQENKSVVSGSAMIHATHRLTHAIRT